MADPAILFQDTDGSFQELDISSVFKKRKKKEFVGVCGTAVDFCIEDRVSQLSIQIITLSAQSVPTYLVRFFKGSPRMEEYFEACDNKETLKSVLMGHSHWGEVLQETAAVVLTIISRCSAYKLKLGAHEAIGESIVMSSVAETADKKKAQRRRSSIIKDSKLFRDSVYESPTIMEGFLEKKSQGYLTQYNRRYFKMAGHYLKYYNVSDLFW
jgi:hypothetical protein